MADTLHQPYRSALLPGLSEVLSLEPSPGLLGLALSGAGSTVVAFADSHEDEIGALISAVFARHGLTSQVRLLEADNSGLVVDALQEEQGHV
jgi:homoserine kinase